MSSNSHKQFLSSMSDYLKAIAPDILKEPYVPAKEISMILGLNVFTVYKMAQRKQIPSYKIGGRRRFKLSEVEDFIKSKCS